MSKVTDYDKMEKVLEYWEEGWVYNDYGDVIDELRGLHTGEKPLCQWSDDEIDAEYENALEYFADQDEHARIMEQE